MIKWKQRLYAFLLRRILGPFLDAASQQKLHESIDVSFQEGTFTLNNVGLSISYLNNSLLLENSAACHIKKARVESISIQLSLLEGQQQQQQQNGLGEVTRNVASSLAWRAMNLGSSVALVAHVEIDGIQLEVEPRPHPNSNNAGADDAASLRRSLSSSSSTAGSGTEEPSSKGVLSSYIEAALASLQLTLNLTNLSIRICQPATTTMQEEKSAWVEVRLPSLSYQGTDTSSSSAAATASNDSPTKNNSEEENESSSRTILEKSIIFQGFTIAAGETTTKVDGNGDDSSSSSSILESSGLVSVIALAEGTGHISLRAVEYPPSKTKTKRNGKGKNGGVVQGQVQQDIDVRLNQQVKVSVDETSLLQLQAIMEAFRTTTTTDMVDGSSTASRDSAHQSLRDSASLSDSGQSSHSSSSRRDEMELYTINGMMKQYNEARQLAERNQMRGGILIPSNAYEEGDNVGAGDPRTFDAFFDANDQSFHHYASMMKSSIMASQGTGSPSDFVHTKLRFHLLGGGVKLSFRNRSSATESLLGPDEYILLTFKDLDFTSKVSGKNAEYALNISHLEVDDAHIPYNNVNSADGRRVEIGSLLSFTQPEFEDDIEGGGDVLVQPACISLHLNVDTDEEEGTKQCDVELNLKPVELVYRHGTLARITTLTTVLSYSGQRDNGKQNMQDSNDSRQLQINSALCTLNSLTLSFPVLEQRDFSPLYRRCSHQVNGGSSTRSSLGLVLDHLTLEHKRRDDTSEKISAGPDMTTSFDCQSIVCFASSPESSSIGNPVGRKNRRLDIFAATGRCEVDPYIPIAIEYRRNSRGDSAESNFGQETFPVVPAFSTFKARQEDEDEDDEIDRILSEKLRNVSVDSRRALRTKDPQSEMLAEAGNCDAVVMVHVPEILMDVSRDELAALLDMIHCIVPREKSSQSPRASPTPPSSSSSFAVSVACDALSLSIHNQESSLSRTTWSSHLLKFDRCRAHTISGGSSMKFMRFFSHETTFFEILDREKCEVSKLPRCTQDRIGAMRNRTARTSRSSAMPVFYRSKLFPAISHGSPSFQLDYIQPKGTEEGAPIVEESEQSVFLSIYNMTYRCNPESKWLDRLLATFKDLELKGKGNSPDHDGQAGETTSSPSGSPSLTRVYLSLADCNLDYTSLRQFKTGSRSILRIGDLRLSSNMLTPAGANQAFSLSIGDISWYLCNTRCPYNFENSRLPGSQLVMAPGDLSFRPLDERESQSGSPTETVFREMGFKTILTLESIDAIVSKINPKQHESKMDDRRSSKEAQLTVSLTLGELSLYACKDSFQCFTGTISELQTKLTALSNEDLKELIKSSPKEIVERVKATKAPSRRNFETIPVDSKADFSLDGYDWTTIDHDSKSVGEIPPGQEQTARWYNSPNTSLDSGNQVIHGDSDLHAATGLQIIHQHFPLHVVSDPMSGGDMDASKFAGTDRVVVNTRILLHDMKLKLRLFDGYDWPEFQTRRKRNPQALFVIDEAAVDADTSGGVVQEKTASSDKPGRKAELMGGLLAGAPDNAETFSDLPLPEERVKSFITQNELRRLSRRTNTYVQFSAQGVSLRLDSYRDSTEHRLKSCLDLALKDFFLAETISSSSPVKMIGEWFNEVQHPRDTDEGLLMLKMVTWDAPCPVTVDHKIASDECEVALTLAPVRCMLDQRGIKFAKAFFRDDGGETDPSQDWKAELHLLPPPFLRVFRNKPVKMKIDYSPQKIDTVALRNGSVVELINLSPLNGMVLTLHEAEIKDSVGFGEAMGGLVSHWLGDICATQMHKFLTNARPFEPLTNVGGGVADLLVLPWDAYKNGESVSRALRSSVSSLVGTVAHETLTTSSRITAFIAGEMAQSTATTSSSSNSSLPSRPLGVPHRVGDTAGHALESLARGVQTANYKVIIVPYREYRRSGTRGAVKSIVKGIPIAVAAPMSGASEALSYTLLGARNQIRPDIRKEEEVSQRGLHYGGRL